MEQKIVKWDSIVNDNDGLTQIGIGFLSWVNIRTYMILHDFFDYQGSNDHWKAWQMEIIHLSR